MDALTRWAISLMVGIIVVFVFAKPDWLLRLGAAGGVAVVMSLIILVVLRLLGKPAN